MEAARFPLVRAEGANYELGWHHGEQVAARIHAHLAYMRETLRLSDDQMRERALRFRPLFERFCPHLLEEIDGLAVGAGISPADALAVNVRAALAGAPGEGCTAFAVGPSSTADGRVLIGQNSDLFAAYADLGYVLHLKPRDRPEVLMWTFGGMIGYHGLNSVGIAHFANDLGDGGPEAQFGLPHYPIKRMILECSQLGEVVELLHRAPLAVNGNYVLCDGSGAVLDVEATTAGPERLPDNGKGYVAHANHFQSARYGTPENDAKCVADSFARLERMEGLLQERLGSIGVADVKVFLSDHDGYPASICRHPRTSDLGQGFETAGQTTASIIAEPAQRRLHVALGSPCRSAFATYVMR